MNIIKRKGGIIISEPVMVPIVAILIGAVLIAVGFISAFSEIPGIRIILSIGGVATVIVGMIMLFGLAKDKM